MKTPVAPIPVWYYIDSAIISYFQGCFRTQVSVLDEQIRKRIEAVKTKQKSQFEAKQKKGMKRCNFAVNDKVLKRNSRKGSRKGDRLTAC